MQAAGKLQYFGSSGRPEIGSLIIRLVATSSGPEQNTGAIIIVITIFASKI